MTQSFQRLLAICIERRLTFAAFRAPNAPVELWVQRQPDPERIAWEALDSAVDRFLVMPFTAEPTGPLAIVPDVRLADDGPDDRGTALADCHGTKAPLHPGPNDAHDAAAIFTKNVALAKERIAGGRLSKVVLARTQQVDMSTDRLTELFAHALLAAPGALVALVSLPEHGTWLGASPERLINILRDHVSVDSLAGTMPADVSDHGVNVWGAKEQEEQALVTAGVVRAFHATGFTDVIANGPNVVTAGPVAHLLTTVSATVGDRSPAALVRELHPTPAVCGTPRSEAMSFILAHEPVQRGLYAGFWGPWRSVQNAQLYVNIRSMQHAAGKATIHAGAGITAASDPDRELRETEEKASTWLAPLAALK